MENLKTIMIGFTFSGYLMLLFLVHADHKKLETLSARFYWIEEENQKNMLTMSQDILQLAKNVDIIKSEDKYITSVIQSK